jgi:hypothetical protein
LADLYEVIGTGQQRVPASKTLLKRFTTALACSSAMAKQVPVLRTITHLRQKGTINPLTSRPAPGSPAGWMA